MNETVQPDSLVTLHYRVATAGDAELVSTFGSTPATLQLGNGELAPPLEHCLIGLTAGEHRAFHLPPQQAFGDRNPQLVQRLPRTEILSITDLELHGLVEFTAPDGGKFTGVVRELDEAAVLIDFNHPLAGKQIHFKVEIIGVLSRYGFKS